MPANTAPKKPTPRRPLPARLRTTIAVAAAFPMLIGLAACAPAAEAEDTVD
jgi:hypothetical protein